MTQSSDDGAAYRCAPSDVDALRERLGPVGVWTNCLTLESADSGRSAARAIEELGYGALWMGEIPQGKEAFTHSAMMLAATDRLVVATGIANIWVRDATAAATAANALAEGFPGRFLLGLGVSHAPLVHPRGHDYGRPYEAMCDYLDALDAAAYDAPLPSAPARVLAALRRKMLELSRDRAHGAHPYFVTPEHTAMARAVLGGVPLLAPEQAVVLETDPEVARRIARHYMSFYLTLPNYLNSLREFGWGDDDFADGGRDALIDAIVAWGDRDRITARVMAHLEAGADHVCVQPLADTNAALVRDLGDLAPALLGAARARR